MATKKQWVEVDNHKLKISNLEKVLYPDDGITKAEIIRYYLEIAPAILPQIKGRPLTLIRYPDGIGGERFFQKDAPDWKPEWIDFITLGDSEKNDYLIADEKAALVWMANLASLEIHQMQSRRPHFDTPDYMVFDLDPPEESDFEEVKDLAFDLKKHIENYGYQPFVKTTGGKGLHLVMPLEPRWEMKSVFEAAKAMARDYVDKHNEKTTLNIKKNARKGRILIDIYRNRSHQTIASPYSLRGTAGAPVSMPLRWAELSEVESSAEYRLRNALEKVEKDGDAWKKIGQFANILHTQNEPSESVKKEPPKSDHHKTAGQLEEYSKKRDFTKTKEPEVASIEGTGNRFVIQRHHATRLHYDLRLERDGVLQSWAVPKGLPPRPGIKRLAVETEDHPLEYLTFEGEIPKGEYGGGMMWVYVSGEYEITKEKKGSLHFRLKSKALSGDYHLYHTKENQWMLEKEDEPKPDWLQEMVEPMHGKRVGKLPKGDYSYEVKWDGIRAMISLEDEEITIHTRNKNEVTAKFPELQSSGALRATCGVFDGEIVYLNKEGKPNFQKIINRLKHSSSNKRKKSDSVYCYLFDCLYLDGRPLVDEPLFRRQEWLHDVTKKGNAYRFSEPMDDGKALLDAVKKQGLEGVMAKKKDSTYHVGERSDLWLKVKTESTVDALVIGYTKGEGNRGKYFGALHLAEQQNGELKYRGKVGTGFDEASLKEVQELLDQLKEIEKPVKKSVQNKKETTWVDPKIVVEVRYANLTKDKLFRAAVFKRLRPDLFE